MRGIVEFFNEQRGFGKIAPADGSPACFAHFSHILDKNERVLVQGEEVEFVVQDDPKGPQARQIERVQKRCRGTVQKFENGFGFIVSTDGANRIFVHYTDIVTTGFRRLEDGEEVTFAVGTGDKGPKAILVRRVDVRHPFERFAALPNFEAQIADLATNLAHKENWSYRETQSPRPFPILRSYLYYTYVKLAEESKIAEATGPKNEPVACFNTGLATERQEAIFAVFRQNTGIGPTIPGLPNPPAWLLDRFAKESDHTLTHFASLPDIANYFTNPVELLYDTRVKLVVDVDHVIGDNKERFPAELQGNEFAMRSALDGAVSAATRRVRRNYKTAIPQYYRGALQLLLPLCLVQPGHADLALVVAKENQVYRASTVLTLDMAYNNARLIARPDTEWLDP